MGSSVLVQATRPDSTRVSFLPMLGRFTRRLSQFPDNQPNGRTSDAPRDKKRNCTNDRHRPNAQEFRMFGPHNKSSPAPENCSSNGKTKSYSLGTLAESRFHMVPALQHQTKVTGATLEGRPALMRQARRPRIPGTVSILSPRPWVSRRRPPLPVLPRCPTGPRRLRRRGSW